MGLASALSTALTGMTAAETTIDVVGNNLANSSTVGFKASEANFATQFLQTRGLGSAPGENSGGTNPRQVGLGVKVAEITPDFSQGTVEISSSPSDLAIQGDGFFIVQSSTGESLYTRNGIFKTNSENELVTISGNRLLGFGVDDDFNIQSTSLVPIDIPLGSAAVAQATDNVFFAGTLIPGEIADTAEIIQSAVLGDNNYEQPADTADIQLAAAPNVAATTATPGAPGALTPGTYTYRIVYYSQGETESEASTDIVVPNPGGNQIAFASLPTSADYEGRRIYRNDPTAPTTFKRVGEIPNQSATTFTDTLDTVAWGATADILTGSIQGSYTYHFTYFNPITGVESRPSPPIGPQNVTDSRVLIKDIPLSGDTDFTVPGPYTIRLYRNLANASDSFYRVVEFTANTPPPPLSYVDYRPDSVISDPLQPGYGVLDFDGPKIAPNTRLVDIIKYNGNIYETVFQPGTLTFTGQKGGSDLKPKTFTISGGPTGTTAQELVDFMTDAMGIQSPSDDPINTIPNSVSPTGPVSPGGSVIGGRLQFVANNGTGNAIEVENSAFSLLPTGLTVPTNPQLGFGSIQTAKGESAKASFRVFDSLGIPLEVTVTAVLEAKDSTTTTYRWFADSGDNDPPTGVEINVGTGLIKFDGEGNVLTVTNDTVSIDRASIASTKPLEFRLDFSELSGLSDTASSLTPTRQDGFGAGTLSSFIIGEDGTIRGVFTNGATRTLGQIRLARFSNPTGLEQRGENLYAVGVNSGLPIEGSPGQQGIGSIIAGATELSNTDIGKNLIDLILASTQYRGNTRVITTAQQLFDELLNLRR